jgi:hypothetical protein
VLGSVHGYMAGTAQRETQCEENDQPSFMDGELLYKLCGFVGRSRYTGFLAAQGGGLYGDLWDGIELERIRLSGRSTLTDMEQR